MSFYMRCTLVYNKREGLLLCAYDRLLWLLIVIFLVNRFDLDIGFIYSFWNVSTCFESVGDEVCVY